MFRHGHMFYYGICFAAEKNGHLVFNLQAGGLRASTALLIPVTRCINQNNSRLFNVLEADTNLIFVLAPPFISITKVLYSRFNCQHSDSTVTLFCQTHVNTKLLIKLKCLWQHYHGNSRFPTCKCVILTTRLCQTVFDISRFISVAI